MGKKPIPIDSSDDKGNLIEISMIDQEARVDSRLIAERMGVDHRSTYRLLTRFQKEVEELGKMRFEIAPSASGQKQRFALLNEDQSIFVLTLSKNTPEVVALKLDLTKAFKKARDAEFRRLRQAEKRAHLAWQTQRQEGKAVRRIETDAIKEFVEYAREQGSKNAHFYYSNITSMGYNNLFLMEKGLEKHFPKKLREYLDIKQIINLSAAELAVEKALRDGMDQGLPYKEIFLFAKTRVETLVSVMGKTRVLPIAPQQQVSIR